MTLDFRTGGLLSLDHLRFGALWLGFGVVLVGGVVVGSLISVPSSVGAIMVQDKLVHLLVYALLMLWFAQLFRHDLTRLLLGLGFAALGVGIEYLQGLVPARDFDVVDMLANASGVLIAWALSYTWAGRALTELERLLARTRSRV